MWELDYKESWTQKNWCFWTVVLEKTLESPLNCKEIKQVHPKGNQSWIFIGRTNAEAETPTLWPPDAKNWLIEKRPWCWERLKSGGEGDDREWDGWTASPTQWTWVWASSRSWWWTGKPGMQSCTWLNDWTDWLTHLQITHRLLFPCFELFTSVSLLCISIWLSFFSLNVESYPCWSVSIAAGHLISLVSSVLSSD